MKGWNMEIDGILHFFCSPIELSFDRYRVNFKNGIVNTFLPMPQHIMTLTGMPLPSTSIQAALDGISFCVGRT